ncbi:VOC family protein [Candidatus Uhrbacteria bacterium]|nr:VOC family protein [Candidatus Uhrbacteria bacterium]
MDKVVHFEIPADDTNRAKEFYTKVFGWNGLSMPDMGYTLFTTGPSGEEGPKEPGCINGGMMKRADFVKAPIITINVDSIEDAGKKIKQHGGEVIREKMAVADMGWAAYFKDSEGNVMGLWQNAK